MKQPDTERVRLAVVAREWARIGCIGFGGPPAHIALLRELCVDRRRWLSAREFEDGIAATNLLPGPASTQLAIYCAWRLRGHLGAVVGDDRRSPVLSPSSSWKPRCCLPADSVAPWRHGRKEVVQLA